jgi:hypothetical protein
MGCHQYTTASNSTTLESNKSDYRKQESLDSQVIDSPIHDFRILPRKGNFATEPLFSPAAAYRATGVILSKLTEAYYGQLDLFGEAIRMQRLSNLYESVDTLREKYGKHTVFLGASFLAHQSAQHDSERGHLPERRRELLPGETARKRLGIPMFMGEVH